MSWDRTHTHRRLLAFTTTNLVLSGSAPTAAPPSLTTSHWTQRSTRIGKAASTLARRTARVWTSPKLSVETNMAVYIACVISTLLFGNVLLWTTHAGQESRFNTFHLRSTPPYPGHILAGQSNQRRCPVSCWSSQYVHSA